jgi:cytochrome P450
MDVRDLNVMDVPQLSVERASAMFRTLRHEAPVHWQAEADGGFWVVTRHRDVISVLRQLEVFSSEWGNILPTYPDGDPTAGLMMVASDPPAHTRLRALLMPSLSPRASAASRPLVTRIVGQLMADIPGEEPFDFMAVVGSRLPIAVSCGLMGVPAADLPYVMRLVLAAHGTKENENGQLAEAHTEDTAVAPANLELLAYFADLAAKRRADPCDDLVSMLAKAGTSEDKLTDEEIASNCFAIALGGYQADRSAVGGAIQVLIEHPDQLSLLRSDPSVMPTAVEEILRWTTPTISLARVARRDTQIGDVPISAGDRVSVWLISANRDEQVFRDPEDFIVTRQPNPHVTFGNGHHFCAGASVARLELTVLLETLISGRIVPELAAPPERLHSYFQQGPRRLPVRFVRQRP